MKRSAFSILIFCLSILSGFATQAAQIGTPLKPFKADFNVLVFGTAIGTAKHTFTCQGKKPEHCQLKSEAIPPSWARHFINEDAIEISDINQTQQDFQLEKYTKHLTRRYSDHTIHKTYTIQRDVQKKVFHYLEKNKTWPLQRHAFDTISMAYAVQYLVLNHRPLTDLYLQDDKSQAKVHFSEQNVKTEIDLDDFPNKSSFFESNPSLEAKRFHFENNQASVTLWLLPKYHYFPGRISVLDKKEDRKIVLELTHLQYQE